MKMTARFSCQRSQRPNANGLENWKNTDMAARLPCSLGSIALFCVFLLFFLSGCTKTEPVYRGEQEAQDFLDKHTADAVNADAFDMGPKSEEKVVALPARFQNPTFLLAESDSAESDEFAIPVGADISSTTGPVSLREIMKKLAVLKGMNVSWASDVDQGALVDVDIRAEDDFFEAIDNILRQLDYFHEISGNSIVVKHKETKKFHIAMPFLAPEFSTGVGGNVLGGSGAVHEMSGTIQVDNKAESDTSFNIWSNIQKNLDQILDIWTTEEVVTTPPPQDTLGATGEEGSTVVTNRKPGKGYYTIDKPIGLITVTAPRDLLAKVESYIENLKEELYRQVSIEAKIVEVTLEADNRTGIDWEDLLQNSSNAFNFNMDFQKLNPAYRTVGTQNKFITLNSMNFNLILDAIEEQGHVEVISNPKISVMNGQPAMISVGETLTYIDNVTGNVEDGVITYSVETSTVMSGLGLAVVATILDNDEVILNLTPVTSQVQEPIEYRQFGAGSEVGLPQVKIREMTTLVRIKNGEMLIVGGLIDSIKDYSESQIPNLGDLPGPGGKLFGNSGTAKSRKELVILLRPVVL
ncbi:MAG: type II and III secretion system protein [Desulfobulbaceae bacterium]|nr:type II and III secretion system protein [Desulfobulbaceae bacterium]